MNRKRILLLTQWFDPEPTFKGIVFARELVNQGFDVEVVTGFPNYPGGKLYPGYRIQMMKREVIDGVEITRVPLYPSHDQSAPKRILNYLSFAFFSLVYCLFFARRASVIYAYHPPLTVGIVAVLTRLVRKIPVVYDIQDLWPDTLSATGMINNRNVLNLVDKVCLWVYANVDRIVVLSLGFKLNLVGRGVRAEKIDTIYNWASEQAMASPNGMLPDTFPSDDKFRILFAGNLGKAQGLDSILEAAAILQDRRSPCCFVMLGNGVELNRLRDRVGELRLNNVVFMPPVPMSEVGLYLNAADALLVHLRQNPLFKITIPSKTQAYMSVGKPLLMAVEGEAREIVTTAGCGVTAEPENAFDIARAAESMAILPKDELKEMGKNAKLYYFQNMSLTVGVGKFSRLFHEISEQNSHYRKNTSRA